MLEVGRAQRTIFIARYLRDRDLQREINAELNVVENYNGVNDYIFFGKSGELSSNRREEREISMIGAQPEPLVRLAAGLGVQAQEEQVRALAARLGYLVIAVFCDNDVSAYSGKPRPQYLKMLDLGDRGHHAEIR
jgi:hypothetical protein